MTTIYLLDSNCFITPARNFYAYDIAPSFWKHLQKCLLHPDVVVIQPVANEIKQDDEIGPWLESISRFSALSTRQQDITDAYRKVIQYVATCGFYNRAGITSWMPQKIADPWLIAAAIVMNNAQIVTQEQPSGNLSTKSQSKQVKIPDVASHFKVSCIGLFDFMRKMNFKL